MNGKDLYLRLLRYVKPHRRIFGFSILATVIAAVTEPALPALLKPLLDGSFVNKDPDYITLMPILLACVFLIRGTAGFASSVTLKWVATQVVMSLRAEMFDKLLVLPEQRYADTTTGNILSKFTYDAEKVMSAATRVLVVLVRDTLALTGLLAWVLYLNWQLSLIMLLIAPCVAVIIRIVSLRLRRLNHQLQDTMGELNHVIDETVQGQRVIKIFGGQDYERERFRKVNNWVRRYHMKLTVAADGSVPIVQFLTAIALSVVIYLASRQAALDELTVGGFVSLFGAMAMMLAPIKRLTNINEELQKGLAAAQSVFALIDETPEPDAGTHSLASSGRVKGQVTFARVGFSYPARKELILRNIDIEVAAGETIALVGVSGSGKTSLVNLLPRFYEPSAGKILLDGVDIATLKLADLRAGIAYVGQQVVLFNDTIAANIAYGAQQKKSREQIVQAAEHAYALEFIDQLERGFDTLIGENGVRLSGGQRQRLAIARALLKDAPVLILDEATSSLDSQSEQQVQTALDTLRVGRTAFIVAHRLSTIENADRILVLSEGEIVETGSHYELLSLDGIYAGLYRLQDNNERTTAVAD